MDPISKTFVAALEEFARREKIPVVQFRKGQRKDDIAAEFFRQFPHPFTAQSDRGYIGL